MSLTLSSWPPTRQASRGSHARSFGYRGPLDLIALLNTHSSVLGPDAIVFKTGALKTSPEVPCLERLRAAC